MSEDEKAVLEAKIKDYEAVLGLRDPNIAVTFRLAPVHCKLLGLLLSLSHVTPELIQQRIELVSDAKVAIYRLRRALAPYAIEIHSQRNVGYWLDDDTKQRIKDMVTPQVAVVA